MNTLSSATAIRSDETSRKLSTENQRCWSYCKKKRNRDNISRRSWFKNHTRRFTAPFDILCTSYRVLIDTW